MLFRSGEDAFFGLGEADAPAGGGGGFDLDRDDLSAGGGNNAFDMSAMSQGMPGMGGMPDMGQMPPGMKMVRVLSVSLYCLHHF